MIRCRWCGSDPQYVAYHDHEWGVPVHDDQRLFEFLILEGAQAGLSWLTILKRREGYRRAFAAFNPAVVAGFDQSKQDELLADSGIIRNRLKIAAAISNARLFLKVQEEYGSFDRYLWGFTGGTTIQNSWATHAEIPASTPLSDLISRDLKKRGFRFVGTTICYALMQAIGMVNDHTSDCYRWKELS